MRHGKRHNPEKKAWKGKSYKKNGERIAHLRSLRKNNKE